MWEALRRVAGRDAAFLDEKAVHDILLKTADRHDGRKSPAFRWNV